MRRWLSMALAVVVLLTLAMGAFADESADIVAGGMVILRLRATVGGASPDARANACYERLNGIVADAKVQPSNIKAVKKGAEWHVMAGSHLFVTVIAAEAKANGTTPEKLAKTWAANLAKALPQARPVCVDGKL